MQHAKKLVLVEPRVLEELQSHRENRELEKPAYKKSRASASVHTKKMLGDDDDIADDLKTKLYQQAFNHFQNLKNAVPAQRKININRLTPPSPPVPAPQPPQLLPWQLAPLPSSTSDEASPARLRPRSKIKQASWQMYRSGKRK